MDFYSSPFFASLSAPSSVMVNSFGIYSHNKSAVCFMPKMVEYKSFPNAFLKNLRRNVGEIKVRKVT